MGKEAATVSKSKIVAKKTKETTKNNVTNNKKHHNVLTKKVDSKTPDSIIIKNHWFIILIMELIGSFLLVLLIIAPGSTLLTVDTNGIEKDAFGQLWDYKVWLAFFIAFGIFILVIIFGHISANFNPAITIVEIYAGNDTVRLGITKIMTQFVGAILAGLAVWGMAEANPDIIMDSSTTLGAPSMKIFMPEIMGGSISGNWSGWWWIIVLLFEGIGTFILLWTVFGKSHSKWTNTLLKKAAFIGIILFFVIWVNDTFLSATLNPARALGPAFVSNWMEGNTTVIDHTMIHVVAQLVAVVIYGGYIQQKIM